MNYEKNDKFVCWRCFDTGHVQHYDRPMTGEVCDCAAGRKENKR